MTREICPSIREIHSEVAIVGYVNKLLMQLLEWLVGGLLRRLAMVVASVLFFVSGMWMLEKLKKTVCNLAPQAAQSLELYIIDTLKLFAAAITCVSLYCVVVAISGGMKPEDLGVVLLSVAIVLMLLGIVAVLVNALSKRAAEKVVQTLGQGNSTDPKG